MAEVVEVQVPEIVEVIQDGNTVEVIESTTNAVEVTQQEFVEVLAPAQIVEVVDQRVGYNRMLVNESNPFTATEVPDAPVGISITPGFSTVLIQWTTPTYFNHSHTEIWASDTNQWSTATLLDSRRGNSATLSIGVDVAKYYWLRHVSLADIEGPRDVGDMAGTLATSGQTKQEFVDSLNGLFGETSFTASVNNTLTQVGTNLTAINQEITDRIAAVNAEGVVRSAAITNEQIARTAADDVMAADISTLQSDLITTNGNVSGNAGAISGLDTRVSTAEGTIISEAAKVSALEAGALVATSGINGNASAISGLDTRVIAAEGTISSHTSDITTLQSTVNNPTTGVAANAAAASSLDSRVTAAEGTISTHSSDITALQASVDDPNSGVAANATAVSSLDTRVTTAEGNITSLASDSTLLNTSISINADGSLVGGGGGQVTTAGLGAVDASTYITDMAAVQNQLDGSITTWFLSGVPTLANAPANTWTDDATKNVHLGDIYYDDDTGFAYRFKLAATVYSWVKITDSDITKALADAAAAQDTADNKRRVFVVQPVPPYDVGDLWDNGAGLLKRCGTAKLEGQSFAAGDWGDVVTVAGLGVEAGADVTATSAAYTGLESRVSTTEGDIISLASDSTLLNTSITIAADGTLLGAGGGKVTPAGLGIEAGADVTATSSAHTALESRVTTAEGTISTHATDITTLQTDLSTANGNISGNAGAISGLDSRVSTTEGDISTHASDITRLDASVERAAERSGLLPNPEFLSEGSDGRPTGVFSGYGSNDPANLSYLDGNKDALKVYSATDSSIGAVWPAFRVNPNATYRVTVRAKTTNADAGSGFYIGMMARHSELASGIRAITSGGLCEVPALTYDSYAWLRNNGGVTTSYVDYVVDWTPDPNAVWASLQVLNWDGMGTKELHLERVDMVEIVDTASLGAATASALSALDARVVTTEGDISTQATQITTLQTDVGDNTATISTQGASIDGIHAQYNIKVTAGGKMVGIDLVSAAADGSSPGISNLVMQADKVEFWHPSATDDAAGKLAFAVENGVTVLQDANIGGYIQSTNYNPGIAGWRIDKQTGLVEAAGIRIYDGAGGVIMASGTGLEPAAPINGTSQTVQDSVDLVTDYTTLAPAPTSVTAAFV